MRRAQRFLGETRAATTRLSENLAGRKRADAGRLFSLHQGAEGLKIPTRLASENPPNTAAVARLHDALAQVNLPRPLLPPLPHEAQNS